MIQLIVNHFFIQLHSNFKKHKILQSEIVILFQAS